MSEERGQAIAELIIPIHALPVRGHPPREIAAEFALPVTWGAGAAQIPAQEMVSVRCSLLGTEAGIVVSGQAQARAHGECVRCLAPLELALSAEITEIFYEPAERKRLLAEGDEEAADAPEIGQEEIDLTPVIRDALVLEIPFDPLCQPDCLGLCDTCGIRWEEAPAGHTHRRMDPRWAALSQLQLPGQDNSDEEKRLPSDGK